MSELYTISLLSDSNLKAYYRLNGNSNDSKNSNNGSDANMSYVDGKFGQAGSFNATTSIITVTDHSTIQNIFDGGGSIAAWIKPNSDGEGDYGKIGNKVQWSFDLNGETGGKCKLRFVQVASGDDGVWFTTNTDITIGTWNHVVMTYNSATVDVNPVIYVNASAVATSETTTPTGTYTSDVGDPLYLGNNAASASTFDGLIDDLAFFDKALSAAEVLNLYISSASLFYQQI